MIKTLVLLSFILIVRGYSQQNYANPALSAYLNVPAGWVMDKTDITDGVIIQVTKAGLTPILIEFNKHPTSVTAGYYKQSFCFSNQKLFYDTYPASTQAPIMSFIYDTTLSSISYSAVNMKQLDSGTIMVSWASSFGLYSQVYTFLTSISDYNANKSLYMQIWQNMSYNAPSGIAKQGATPRPELAERKAIYDAAGRAMAIKENPAPIFWK